MKTLFLLILFLMITIPLNHALNNVLYRIPEKVKVSKEFELKRFEDKNDILLIWVDPVEPIKLIEIIELREEEIK